MRLTSFPMLARVANRFNLTISNNRLANMLQGAPAPAVLKNVTYTGRVALHARAGGTDVFKGKHPAIIDRELFEDVQRALACRRRFDPPAKPFGRVPYPLSGARCAFCGEGLTGCSQKIAGRYRYEYYRCSTAQRRGRHACRQPMVRTPVLEDQLAAYLGGMTLPEELLADVVDELRQRRGRRAREPRTRRSPAAGTGSLAPAVRPR